MFGGHTTRVSAGNYYGKVSEKNRKLGKHKQRRKCGKCYKIYLHEEYECMLYTYGYPEYQAAEIKPQVDITSVNNIMRKLLFEFLTAEVLSDSDSYLTSECTYTPRSSLLNFSDEFSDVKFSDDDFSD